MSRPWGDAKRVAYNRFPWIEWYNSRPLIVLRSFEDSSGDETRLKEVSQQEIRVRAALNSRGPLVYHEIRWNVVFSPCPIDGLRLRCTAQRVAPGSGRCAWRPRGRWRDWGVAPGGAGWATGWARAVGGKGPLIFLYSSSPDYKVLACTGMRSTVQPLARTPARG